MRSRITVAVYRLRVGQFEFKPLGQFQFKRVGQFEFKRLEQVAFKRATKQLCGVRTMSVPAHPQAFFVGSAPQQGSVRGETGHGGARGAADAGFACADGVVGAEQDSNGVAIQLQHKIAADDRELDQAAKRG